MKTAPRLPTAPVPTLYYLTDPRLTSAASRLESPGVMKEMSQRLADDEELAAAYRRAHEGYLAERDAINRWAPISAAAHARPGEMPASC